MTNISIRSVSKHYGDQLILDNINLDVADGKILALLGPSGCGKTTLLRLIAGFERPDQGEVQLGASVVEAQDRFVPPQARHIGYVPQEGALFPHLSVGRNIGYGLSRKNKPARIAEMLQLVGLSEYADKNPRELSGGQQQRVALARALAPRPAVILLDEPFSALDIDMRRRMSAEVTALLRRVGATALLVTHDPIEAFAAADLVAVLEAGKIIECGSPEALYRAPINQEVAKLTGRTIFLEGTMHGAGKAETLLGQVDVTGSALHDKMKVLVLVRPEQVEVAPAGQGIEAIIKGYIFLGSHSIVTIAIRDLVLDLETYQAPEDRNVFIRLRGPARAFAQ